LSIHNAQIDKAARARITQRGAREVAWHMEETFSFTIVGINQQPCLRKWTKLRILVIFCVFYTAKETLRRRLI